MDNEEKTIIFSIRKVLSTSSSIDYPAEFYFDQELLTRFPKCDKPAPMQKSSLMDESINDIDDE